MSFTPAAVATFDAPLGFTTEAIVTSFNGIVSGLNIAGAACSVYVRAGYPCFAMFTQISSLAVQFSMGSTPCSCVGQIWSLTSPQAMTITVETLANGATAVWTPAAGKRFRLLAYSIDVAQNSLLSVAGLVRITLTDGGTALGQGFTAYVPALLGQADASTGWRTLGLGKLSAAANNVLAVNLSTSLSAGAVRVNVFGTEE